MGSKIQEAIVKHYNLFIIACLILVIVFQRQCHICPKCPVTKNDTIFITHIDTISTHTTHLIPKPVYVDTGSTLWRYKDVDTAAILKDYHSKRIYDRLLIDNEYGKISLVDSVYYNRLNGYSLKSDFYKRTDTVIINKQSILPNKRKLFVGLVLSQKPSVAPSLMFQDKKDRVYSLSADPINKNYEIGLYWKIKLKK